MHIDKIKSIQGTIIEDLEKKTPEQFKDQAPSLSWPFPFSKVLELETCDSAAGG
jgi:hypothetical protein